MHSSRIIQDIYKMPAKMCFVIFNSQDISKIHTKGCLSLVLVKAYIEYLQKDAFCHISQDFSKIHLKGGVSVIFIYNIQNIYKIRREGNVSVVLFKTFLKYLEKDVFLSYYSRHF